MIFFSKLEIAVFFLRKQLYHSQAHCQASFIQTSLTEIIPPAENWQEGLTYVCKLSQFMINEAFILPVLPKRRQDITLELVDVQILKKNLLGQG